MLINFTSRCRCFCGYRFENDSYPSAGGGPFPSTGQYSYTKGVSTHGMTWVGNGDYSFELFFNPDSLLSYQKSTLVYILENIGLGTEVEVSLWRGIFGDPTYDDTKILLEFTISTGITVFFDITDTIVFGKNNYLVVSKSGLLLSDVKATLNKIKLTPIVSVSTILSTLIKNVYFPQALDTQFTLAGKVITDPFNVSTYDFMYSGTLSQVRIYSRVLSREEILKGRFYEPLNPDKLIFWAPLNDFDPFRLVVPIYGGNYNNMIYYNDINRASAVLVDCEPLCNTECVTEQDQYDILPLQRNDTISLPWDFTEYYAPCGEVKGPVQVRPELCTLCDENKPPPEVTSTKVIGAFYLQVFFKLAIKAGETTGVIHIQKWKTGSPTIDPPILINYVNRDQLITDLLAVGFFYYHDDTDTFEYRYTNCEVLNTLPPPCGCESQELTPVFIATEDDQAVLTGLPLPKVRRSLSTNTTCKECIADKDETFLVVSYYNFCMETVSPLTCVNDAVLRFTVSNPLPAYYRCPLSLCFKSNDAVMVCANSFDYRETQCDTLLIRWRNHNQIYRQLRIRALLNKKTFKKDQDNSESTKNQIKKLRSEIDNSYILETDYYTPKVHDELIRAVESDFFEIFVKDRWVSYFSSESYEIVWEEAPIPYKGKGRVNLLLTNYKKINVIE